jgi:hypothetical protein
LSLAVIARCFAGTATRRAKAAAAAAEVRAAAVVNGIEAARKSIFTKIDVDNENRAFASRYQLQATLLSNGCSGSKCR